MGRVAFWAPFWGLWAMYDDHIRLIGKSIVYFLSVLTNSFVARCYGWGAIEYRFKIGDFAPRGASWRKISVGMGRPPTKHSYQKNRLNDLSYGIPICIDLSSDRKTDGRTQLSHRYTASAFHAAREKLGGPIGPFWGERAMASGGIDAPEYHPWTWRFYDSVYLYEIMQPLNVDCGLTVHRKLLVTFFLSVLSYVRVQCVWSELSRCF